MLTFPYEFLLIVILVLLLITTTIRSYIFKKKAERNSRKLHEVMNTVHALENKYAKLEEEKSEEPVFDKQLNQAEVTSKLQTSRIHRHINQSKVKTPERYSYIRTLIDKGLNSDEIASVLAISPQEALQLVKLSELSGQK